LEILSFAQKAVRVLEKTMFADGFNLGLNIGRVAGAGIDKHLHLHVVPRWNGDVNFMSVTAETKVLPEALSVTRDRLIEEWNKKDSL
jgi:ATP adenylyltransferase